SGDGGDADATFVEGAFETAEAADAVEEGNVDFFLEVCGAIVGAEDDEGAFGELESVEFRKDGSGIAVKAADHGRIGCAGREVRSVASAGSSEGCVIPAEFEVGIEFLIGNVQRDMRKCGGKVEEEGTFAVLTDELERSVTDPVGRVIAALEGGIAGGVGWVGVCREFGVAWDRRVVIEGNFFSVVPEVVGVVAVGVSLAVIAEEAIEALSEWIAFGARSAESPFAEGSSDVAFGFEDFGECYFGGGDWELTFRAGLAVIANPCMSGMFAGHEHAAGGGADGIAAVVLGKHLSLCGKSIEVGCADFLLSEAAKFAMTKVISEDENDIERRVGREQRAGCLRRSSGELCGGKKCDSQRTEQECSAGCGETPAIHWQCLECGLLSDSADREDGGKVEALKPRHDGGEAGFVKACDVGFERFGEEAIFDGRAFLCDFQIGIAVCAFEVVVQICEQLLGGGVVEAEFFGEQESASGEHSRGNSGDQRVPVGGGNELKCEVEYNKGGGVDGKFADVSVVDFDGAAGFRGFMDERLQAVDHRCRIIDSVDCGCHWGAAPNEASGSAEGAAEVPCVCAGLNTAGGELFDDGENGGVAGD
ncbi:MAG: hypothetical protein RL215_1079, partial [Planctomycetota bacterium]